MEARRTKGSLGRIVKSRPGPPVWGFQITLECDQGKGLSLHKSAWYFCASRECTNHALPIALWPDPRAASVQFSANPMGNVGRSSCPANMVKGESSLVDWMTFKGKKYRLISKWRPVNMANGKSTNHQPDLSPRSSLIVSSSTNVLLNTFWDRKCSSICCVACSRPPVVVPGVRFYPE